MSSSSDPTRPSARRRLDRRNCGDDGVSLLEVVVAFTVLMIALVPLSYLFTTAVIQAGQSTNQQTALSIAEKWVETLSNTTPPVNSNGEVVVDKSNPPEGPAPSSASTTVASGSNNKPLATATTIYVTSVANFAAASTTIPQIALVTTGSGSTSVTNAVTYTGIDAVNKALTGCSCGTGTGTMFTGNAVTQANVITPTETRGGTTYSLSAKYSWATAQSSGSSTLNLCSSGNPQLLKLTVAVSWGPNADGNLVQDSVMLNYPPAGVQTLGFIAMQMSGDTTANDAQSPSHPWSYRVQSIPVTISGPQTLQLNPDSYGCVFAQVLPGTYTVSAADPVSGNPPGTTYGAPLFVANAAGTVSNHIWSQPTSLPTGSTPSVTVAIGAVTRVAAAYPTAYPGFDQGSTVNLTYPSSTSVEDGVTCPGSGTITCITTGENGSGTAAVNWANQGAWSTASVPSGSTRITSVACAGSVACIGVGYGPAGPVILRGTTGASPGLSADTVPAGVAGAGGSLNQVICPSTSACVAVGTSSTGSGIVLAGVITSGSDTWVQDTLAGTTSLFGLMCPSATGCAAIGTTASGGAPVLVSGPAGAGSWAAGTPNGFSLSALSQVTCPTVTTCVAIGTGKVGSATSPSPVVITGAVTGGTGLGSAGSSVTWTADAEPGVTLASLQQVICPTASKCLVSGAGTAGSQTGALVLYGNLGGPLSAEFPLDSGATVTNVAQLTCPSSTACYGIGSNASGPEIFTGAITAGPTTADTWTSDTPPTGNLDAVSQIVCPAATSCLIMGTGTQSSGGPAAFLLSTSNGSTWNTVSLPSADGSVAYFDGIGCTVGASPICAAAGASPTGSIIVTSTTGPAGSWSDQTPNGLSGYASSGIPIEINNSGLLPGAYVNVVTAGAATNVTQLPDLYPFAGGYGLWAGDCQAEGLNGYNVSVAATVPGGTSGATSGMSTPTVPLGLLSFQVLNASGPAAGLPHAGVSLRLQVPANGNGCGQDSYNLQTSGADGFSRTLVPYGTYNLFVNGSGTSYGTVTVTGNERDAHPDLGRPGHDHPPLPADGDLMRALDRIRATSCGTGRSPMNHRPGRDDGLTLVELLVAFAALMVLFTVAGTVLTTYVSTGTSVISNYTSTDELLPGSIIIQRLIRSEVEPAPAPPAIPHAPWPTHPARRS